MPCCVLGNHFFGKRTENVHIALRIKGKTQSIFLKPYVGVLVMNELSYYQRFDLENILSDRKLVSRFTLVGGQ